MANKPIIESTGITIDKFYIPPFTLMEGEIVILYLYNGAHFYKLYTSLVDIFIGKVVNKHVIINEEIAFVPHIKERTFRRPFLPRTVGGYIRAHTNKSNKISERVYGKYINSKTKINTIGWDKRKLLSLFCTLSKSTNVVFDLVGIGPGDGKKIFEIVKENIQNGGAAILLNSFDDFKNDCTKFIVAEALH